MNICIIHSAADKAHFSRRGLLLGRLSYAARKNTLMSEKLSPDARGDVMILSANDIGEHITPAIYDECRRRGYESVFLDADEDMRGAYHALSEVSESLSRRTLSVFCPLCLADVCQSAIPVAEAALSGGVLSEYIEQLMREHRRLALSVPRIMTQFTMPVQNASGYSLSRRELSRIIDMHDAKVHYSPQMMVNYCIYSSAPEQACFVLFDDARTISEKLRLARRMGITDVFLTYREIADIADDIVF